MKTLPWILAAALLAGMGEARAQAPDRVVFVHGPGEGGGGRGITRRRGDDCFVVAPDHVVRGEVGDPSFRAAPHVVRIVASQDRLINTTFITPLEGDLALLRVDTTSEHESTLCASWPRRIWTTRELQRRRETVGGADGWLVGVNDGAGDAPMEITLGEVDPGTRRFWIRPRRDGEPFTSGVSGSLVYVNGRPAGIVKRVNADSVIAEVQSLEAATEQLDPYLETEFPPSRALIRTSLLFPGRGQLVTRRGEVGVAWFAATLAASTYLLTKSETIDRTEVFPDEFGVPRSYPYQERTYPLQWYGAAVWVASGVLSTWEAGHFARTGYGRGRTAPRTSLRIDAYPTLVAGERAVVVGAGFSF
jgi:hypothetical protein